MRVLATGGRDFDDFGLLLATLDDIHNNLGITCIIEGESRGADLLARRWAQLRSVEFESYPADWNGYAGKRAGFVRNAKMLKEGKPDLVIAFPGGNGTRHMCQIARAAGVDVLYVKAREVETVNV